MTRLLECVEVERKALLRHWLQQQGFILPSARKLDACAG
ncbi:MAG: TilS substrate-binding domain-containing protein [Thiolinea sp.]